MKRKFIAVILGAMLLSLTACSSDAPEKEKTAATPAENLPTLTIMTHDSFSMSKEVLAAFEKAVIQRPANEWVRHFLS